MAKKNVEKKKYDGVEIDTMAVTENEKIPGSVVDDKGNTFFDTTDPITRLLNATGEEDIRVGRLSAKIFNRNVGDMKKPSFGENPKESRPIFALNEDGTKKEGLRPSDTFLNTVVPVRCIAVDMAQASNIANCITTDSALTFLGIQIVAFRNSIMFLLNNTAEDISNVLNNLISRNLDNIEMDDFTRSTLKHSSVRVRSDIFPRNMLGDLKSYYPIEMDRSYFEGDYDKRKRVERVQQILRVSEQTIPIMACEISSGITLSFYEGIRFVKSQLVRIGTDETDIENTILDIMREYEHVFYPEIARYIINTLEECARIAYVYISSALTKENVEIPTKPRDYTPPFSYKYPGCCDD